MGERTLHRGDVAGSSPVASIAASNGKLVNIWYVSGKNTDKY